jgi:hypothetical protein
MDYAWTCKCCGKQYNTLPLDWAFRAPDPWFAVPEAERDQRGKLDQDLCMIDNKDFFVRGCLEIPLIDANDCFTWGVWVSVSRENFERVLELWDATITDEDDPFFGWLCNDLDGYPTTYALKTMGHLRNSGKRPFIELEPTDHPLAVEQRQGISIKRVEEMMASLLRHS